MAYGGISINMDSLIQGIKDIDQRVRLGSLLYAETAAQKLENHAKEDAPWTDRTGNSRQTIDHAKFLEGNKIIIQIRGNTPHFKYLELAMEKKYAILWPTIQKHKAEIIKGWKVILNN